MLASNLEALEKEKFCKMTKFKISFFLSGELVNQKSVSVEFSFSRIFTHLTKKFVKQSP